MDKDSGGQILGGIFTICFYFDCILSLFGDCDNVSFHLMVTPTDGWLLT